MQTSVDLSQILQPDIVVVPDFETVLADIRALIVAAMPAELQASVSAALLLESEPMAALAQAFTYREIHLLQRINEAVRAVLLSSALGADLDQVAGNFDTERLLITGSHRRGGRRIRKRRRAARPHAALMGAPEHGGRP
ncbi:baseplate J-like protein [Klebsiella pneumoniae subsp. pneumoniae]|nr:baseplate J-like protein [Klebsiella pneumoniae subsp. pneumoniae]